MSSSIYGPPLPINPKRKQGSGFKTIMERARRVNRDVLKQAAQEPLRFAWPT